VWVSFSQSAFIKSASSFSGIGLPGMSAIAQERLCPPSEALKRHCEEQSDEAIQNLLP
jgi:hypothetical protein